MKLICRIQILKENNIQQNSPRNSVISRGSILENLKREETEFSTDGKPYTKNLPNPLHNENEFHRFCKTLNMIETERKKQIEILKVVQISIPTLVDSVTFRVYLLFDLLTH